MSITSTTRTIRRAKAKKRKADTIIVTSRDGAEHEIEIALLPVIRDAALKRQAAQQAGKPIPKTRFDEEIGWVQSFEFYAGGDKATFDLISEIDDAR